MKRNKHIPGGVALAIPNARRDRVRKWCMLNATDHPKTRRERKKWRRLLMIAEPQSTPTAQARAHANAAQRAIRKARRAKALRNGMRIKMISGGG